MPDPLRSLHCIAENVSKIFDAARKSGSISFDNLCLLVPEDANIVEIEELIAVLDESGIVVDDEDDDEKLEADDAAMLEALRDLIAAGHPMPQMTGAKLERLARTVDRDGNASSQPPT
jgi:hypothetical protein